MDKNNKNLLNNSLLLSTPHSLRIGTNRVDESVLLSSSHPLQMGTNRVEIGNNDLFPIYNNHYNSNLVGPNHQIFNNKPNGIGIMPRFDPITPDLLNPFNKPTPSHFKSPFFEK